MPNRGRSWSDTLFNVLLVSGAAQINSDLLANAPVADTLTVVRLVVDLQGYVQTTISTVGSQSLDVGIGVSSLEAFGVNALPDVNVDDEYPPRGWLYINRKVAIRYAIDSPTVTARHQVDLRAMRRIDKGKLFVSMSTTAIDGTSQAVRVTGRIRALCLT